MNITSAFTGSPRLMRSALILAVALSSTGCGLSNKAKGTAVGVAAGGAAGAAIGRNNGSTARGAILGAVVGGAAGAIIGSQMDKQAGELMDQIPGATVERVGEGIQVTFASGLLFDFDSNVIRPDAAANLRNLATSLKEYANTNLLIVGHTDSSGATQYNQDLSIRRADSASRFLTMQGVGSGRVRTVGQGEMEPITSNETEAGRQANRRIEVAIYAATGNEPQSR